MAEEIKQTPAQDALAKLVDTRWRALSKGRWAEEREWYQAGLFDQLKQWLEEGEGKKLRPIKPDAGKKWPMPVSNHFSKTIATNANSLGAAIPEMLALSDNYDAKNRRAAEAAENAIDAANRESGMEILNPTLARHIVLWGLGCTLEEVAFDHSTDEIPELEEVPQQPQLNAPPQVQPPTGEPMPPQQPGAPPTANIDPQTGEAPPEMQAQVVGTERIPSPRLKSELVTVFEIYLPRTAQDANLAPYLVHRRRMPMGEARELYPQFAEKLTKDTGEATDSLAVYFLNSLRSLAYMSQSTNEGDDEMVTFSSMWTNWASLTDEVQDAIEGEWESEQSAIYPNMSKLDAAVEFGLFVTTWGNTVVEWGENPWDGECPYTFFPWQKDAASVYPKGLSTEIVPLQKQLNRLDSLMERAIMSHGAVKLLWPTTQTTPAPTGDPVDLTYYDTLGDGKVKPEYFAGHAYGPEINVKRQQILDAFKELGFTNEVADGEMPGSGTAFRALAFLGAKAEESRKTQRYLYEQAHELRARKLLKMARKVWDQPRKVQVAGFNNRFGAQMIEAADLEGEYELNVVQDSSRPKTMTEKLEAFQMLVQGGVVNPSDPSVREWLLDTLSMGELNLTDHLNFAKSDRDLEKLKNGIQPMESPAEKWDVILKTLGDYTLTEEYEGLDPEIKTGILMYFQYCSDKLSMIKAPLGPGGPPPPGAQPPGGHPDPTKGGIGGQPAPHVLNGVPGLQMSTGQVQNAANIEANSVVPQAGAPGN